MLPHYCWRYINYCDCLIHWIFMCVWCGRQLVDAGGNMKYVLVIALSVMAMGCSTVKIVPDAVDNEPVNYVTVCTSPFDLTQDCSFTSPTRATKTIKLCGFHVKIAGSEAGDVIFVTDAKFISNRIKDGVKIKINSPSHSQASNDSYYMVQDVLEKEGIKIKNVRPVKSFGNIDGYLLELDADGYSILDKYSVSEE